MPYIAIYLAAINLLAIALTAHDKRAAQQRKTHPNESAIRRGSRRRVRESTLQFIAALGGSVAMLLTMRVIRHKTKHTKFMVGIPVIIAAQILLAVGVWRWML